MPYVDGFVLPVPKNRIADYETMARAAKEIWMDHGALEYWECVGDDVGGEGHHLSFTGIIGAGEDENVIFAWVVFESREARDTANEKIAADPRTASLMDADDPVFDCKRIAHGGFKVLVQT